MLSRQEGQAIINAAQRLSPTVADAFRRFGPSYMSRHALSMPPGHRRAIKSIINCRTAELGGHVVECEKCRMQDYAYHSCRHRSCPTCMADVGEEWFQSAKGELLPVPYFHLVFSVPHGLNKIIRGNPRALYPVLMQAASQAVLEVAAAPEHLGGEVGVMATLHTWSRTLAYHPHVHCLVPAGSVDEQGQWQAAKGPRLAPEGVLAKAFRDTLRGMMKHAVAGLELPDAVFDEDWQVFAEQPEHGAEAVLRYLGRPLHRGPLCDYRIVEVTDTGVVFRYRSRDRAKWRTLRLDGHEFLRRFLQHVWPNRLHKVRYSGLWSRRSRPRLKALRQKLLAAAPVDPCSASASPGVADTDEPSTPHWMRCPHCGHGKRVIISRFGRGVTPPPLRQPPPASAPIARPP